MAYQFHTVFLSTPDTFQVVNSTNLGIGSDYNGFVMSAWFTVGAVNPSAAMTLSTGGGSNGGIDVNLTTTRVGVAANDSSSVIIGEFIASVTTTVGEFVNLLVSFDGVTHQLQAYVNDQPVGSFTGFWVSHNQIGHAATDWTVQGTGCFGDLWFQPQSTFVDLTVTANRRKFINADLTPVDLGSNGSTPFGSQPPLFLHVAPTSVTPSDFVTNLGSGGSFSPSSIVFGSCGVYPPTIPVSENLEIADLWFSPTPGFVDLSQAATRAQWVNPDGSAPYLGADGSLLFGSTPPVFLTLAPGQPAADWANNVGNGGAFTVTSPPLVLATPGPPCSTYVTPLVPPDNVQGQDPLVVLSVSDDGGRTWSSLQKPRSLGKIGEYLKRVRWLKMGQFRQRVIRLDITDPVKRAIVGFYADLKEGME